jgi:hypothetical protein
LSGPLKNHLSIWSIRPSSRSPVASVAAFSHLGTFEISNAKRPKPINPRNIRSGYLHFALSKVVGRSVVHTPIHLLARPLPINANEISLAFGAVDASFRDNSWSRVIEEFCSRLLHQVALGVALLSNGLFAMGHELFKATTLPRFRTRHLQHWRRMF